MRDGPTGAFGVLPFSSDQFFGVSVLGSLLLLALWFASVRANRSLVRRHRDWAQPHSLRGVQRARPTRSSRQWSRAITVDRLQFSVVQNYTSSRKQRVPLRCAIVRREAGGTAGAIRALVLGVSGVEWSAVTLLGAVNSRPFEPSIVPTPGPEPSQGVSEKPHEYDYGPGWTFGASRHGTGMGRRFSRRSTRDARFIRSTAYDRITCCSACAPTWCSLCGTGLSSA